jgi:cytochrome c oxidase assembly protein subunit 15
MRVTPERYRQIAIASLVALFVVIVAGAAVRLTNSGLGCDDWPNCNETTFVDVSSKHAAIEQINRMLNAIVTVAVLTVGVLAHRVHPRPRGAVALAWSLVALVAANAVLGGISVLVDLHPLAIQGHLLLALAALVVNFMLVARCSPPRHASRISRRSMQLVWCVATGTSAAIVAGTLVTGSGPHAGDEDAPRLDLDIESIARLHGVIVIATIVAMLALAVRANARPDERRTLADAISIWLIVGIAQALVGYTQYLNDLPELLVGIHVGGAAAITLATTHVVVRANPGYADGTPSRTLEVGAAAT